MTTPIALGEKLLTLLDETATTSTYKPALLLAIIDRAPEGFEDDAIGVRSLAERVIELYWPHTLGYPTTGKPLVQSQAGKQATILARLAAHRATHGATGRSLPGTLRTGRQWELLVHSVEKTLAEWPIPRLQNPYQPFIYEFDWRWGKSGGWSVRAYDAGSRSIRLLPGVVEGLIALAPLLRPFITRWWADKAARLNPGVEAARSLVEFEDFMFGRDRVALERIAEGLLDLQHGACIYCHRPVGRDREIDHFVPWTHSGDDGLDNLVAACRRCNNDKRATLAGPEHLAAVFARNQSWDHDLRAIADERRWPRDRERTLSITRAIYLRAPDERPLWLQANGPGGVLTVGAARDQLRALLG